MTLSFILSMLGAAIAAVIAAFTVGKSKAKAQAATQRAADNEAVAVRQANEERTANEAAINTVKGASDARNEVTQLGPDSIADELRTKWSRD